MIVRPPGWVIDGCNFMLSQVNTMGSSSMVKSAVPSSSILGSRSKVSVNVTLGIAKGKSRIVAEAEKPATKVDSWSGLGTDISDDQQDIQRGKGMVDALF